MHLKILVFSLVFLIPMPLKSAENNQLIPEIEQKIDNVLYLYYSGKTQEAKGTAQNLTYLMPDDPFLRELLAEIVWQELDKKTGSGQPKDKKRDSRTVKENWYLVEQFYSEIYSGLVSTQNALSLNGSDSKNMFLRGMLLVRQGGFIAKFETGLKSYREADSTTAEGMRLLKKSMAIDPSLCSAKYIFALSKYVLIKNSDDWISGLAIRFGSEVFQLVDADFDVDDVFEWLDESMKCGTNYYYTKDIMLDKKFVYQDILFKQAGKMDKAVLPVLIELNKRFPENTVIRDNLFLIQRHLNNEKR